MKDNVIGIIICNNKIWGYLIGMVTTIGKRSGPQLIMTVTTTSIGSVITL